MLNPRNTLIDFNLKNLKVLVRVDFNVPYSMDPTNLLSDLKILSSIPTINYLLENKILSLPNYIKIDVDGIEHLILQGADKFLSKEELKSI